MQLLKKAWALRAIIFALFICGLLSSVAMADRENVAVEDGTLIINAHGNHFANVVFYPRLQGGEYGEASFETMIRGGVGAGTSYEPGLFLYWRSTNHWVSIRFVSQYYVVEGNMGKWFRYRDSSLKSIGSWGAPGTDEDWLIPDRNEWNRFKIVLTPEEIRFYVAYLDEDWQHLCTLERVITDEEPYLILGRGSPTDPEKPYLTRSHSSTGSYSSLYIDDVEVKVDDKVILRDTFDRSLGRQWIPLWHGDPELDAKISFLDALPTEGDGQVLGNITLIYPNPSLKEDDVRIAYHTSMLERVKIAIYNENGELVWDTHVMTEAIGYNEVIWDGYGKGGTKVPPGLYTCVISRLQADTSQIISMGRIVKVEG